MWSNAAGQELAIDPLSDIDRIKPHVKVRPVLAYWQHAQQRRGQLPRRRDLDACAFISCLGDMMLLKVLEDGSDYRYDLVGENLRNLFNVTYLRRSLLQIRFPDYETVLAEYRQVVEERHALYLERRQISERNFMEIIVGKLILPLSDDGQTVDDLLVCLAVIG